MTVEDARTTGAQIVALIIVGVIFVAWIASVFARCRTYWNGTKPDDDDEPPMFVG